MYLKTILSLGVTVVAIAGYLTASGFSRSQRPPPLPRSSSNRRAILRTDPGP